MSHFLTDQTCLTLEEVHGTGVERRRLRYLNADETLEEALLPFCKGDTVGETLRHGKTMWDEFQAMEFHQDAMFTLFRKTLQESALISWATVYDAIPTGTDLDMQRFRQALLDWIAESAHESDRASLLRYLRGARKPMSMTCEKVKNSLLLLNSMVEWLPGTEAPLTADGLRQAYFDLMPQAWRNRFMELGRPLHNETLTSLRTYFANQERLSAQLQQANNSRQGKKGSARSNNRAQGAQSHSEGSQSQQSHGGRAGKRRRGRDRFRSDKRPYEGQNRPKNAQTRGSRVEDDAPCPVHPGSLHVWRDCRLNIANARDRDSKPHATNPAHNKRSGPTKGANQGHSDQFMADPAQGEPKANPEASAPAEDAGERIEAAVAASTAELRESYGGESWKSAKIACSAHHIDALTIDSLHRPFQTLLEPSNAAASATTSTTAPMGSWANKRSSSSKNCTSTTLAPHGSATAPSAGKLAWDSTAIQTRYDKSVLAMLLMADCCLNEVEPPSTGVAPSQTVSSS